MLPDPYNAPFDSATPSDYTPFTLINCTPNSSFRKNVGAAVGAVSMMRVSHTTVGKGSTERDRHLVSFELKPVVDGVETNGLTAKLYLVGDFPKNGITAAQLGYLWQQMSGTLKGVAEGTTHVGNATVFFNRWKNGEL